VTCGVAGAGWCLAAGHHGVSLLERAAGTGLGGLILAGAVADRVGLRLGSRPVAIGIVAAVTGAGLLAALVSERRQARPHVPGATTTRTTPESLPSSIAPSLP